MSTRIRVAVAGSLISWGELPHTLAANHGAIGVLDPIHYSIEAARARSTGGETQPVLPCARTA